MKQLFLILAVALCGYGAYAQNTFPSSGNVGMGTTSPITYLQVYDGGSGTGNSEILNLQTTYSANGAQKALTWRDPANITGQIATYYDGTYTNMSFGHLYHSGYQTTDLMTLMGNGNVGIGTTSPSEKLQVDGNIYVVKGGGSTLFLANSNYVSYVSSIENGGYSDLSLAAHNTERIRILGSNGNVGIGTTIPDQKLTVNGTIHSTAVKVDLSVPGPDYVFKPSYKLTGLSALKTYIDKNHHLPEIPTASQMDKNGIDLGDMNIKLLKKVEELTLYLIRQDKQVATQSKQLSSQQKTNQHLQQQVDQLKKQLETVAGTQNKK